MNVLEQKKRNIFEAFYKELVTVNPNNNFIIHEPMSYNLPQNYIYVIGIVGHYAQDFMIETNCDFIIPTDPWNKVGKDIPHTVSYLVTGPNCPVVPDNYDAISIQSLNPNSEQIVIVHFIGGKSIQPQKDKSR